MLDIIEKQFEPFITVSPYKHEENTAAVLVALVNHPNEPTVILTQRAEHLNSHPGQVSFPGGKYETHDDNLLVTALRETHEEIGLPESEVRVLAELSFRKTRFQMGVLPFLGVVEPGWAYQIDRSELDAVFEVPLRFFMDQSNARYQLFEGANYSITMPCYHYEGYTIWGFTLGVLVDFLNDTLQAGIVLEYPPH